MRGRRRTGFSPPPSTTTPPPSSTTPPPPAAPCASRGVAGPGCDCLGQLGRDRGCLWDDAPGGTHGFGAATAGQPALARGGLVAQAGDARPSHWLWKLERPGGRLWNRSVD